MDIAKNIVKNSFYLYMGDIIAKVLTFLMIIALARHFGAGDFGKFSFAMAFTTLLYFTIDFGTNRVFVRDVASNKRRFRQLFNQCLSQKILLSVLFVPLFTFLIYFSGKTADVVLLVFLFAVSVMINSFTEFLKAVFRTVEKMEFEGVLKATERIFWFVGALFIIFKGLSLQYLGFLFIFASVINLFLGLLFMRRVKRIGFSWNLSFSLIRRAVPFAISAVFYTIYYRIALVLLSFMHGDVPTGVYNASFQFIEALLAIPIIFQSAIFPALSRAFHSSKQTYVTILKKALKILILIAFPIVVGTLILAKDIIAVIYGGSYGAAVPILQILILSIVFVFISNICAPFLMAGKKEKAVAYSILFLLAFNVFLNVLLIYFFTTIGAAVATVVTDFLFGMLMLYFVFKLTKEFPIGFYFFKVGAAALLMGLVTFFLPVHLILKILASGVVYFVLILVFRVFSEDDWVLIKKVFPLLGGQR